ncbi:MAG: anti-sigma regulatory factor [Acidobacteriota bacterium]
MIVTRSETLMLRTSEDIVRTRQTVRAWMVEMKFSLIDQTKMITAASELARNTVEYGGGGTVTIHEVENGAMRGLRVVFEDEGPGIADVETALRDGYTSGGGLGLGLGGSKRLVHEFDIHSVPGEGTRVTIVRWK